LAHSRENLFFGKQEAPNPLWLPAHLKFHIGVHYVCDGCSTFDKRLVAANNRFGFKLFNQLQLKDQGKNVFLSPLSVALALSMTYTGASGETQEAMRRTLKTEGLSLDERDWI
jgi:serine protease inhibitor